MTLDKLSPERRLALIAHLMDEFNLTEQQAVGTLLAMDETELAAHLSACEEGYF